MDKKEVVQPEGNYYDKYHAGNPITKLIMNGYFHALDDMLSKVKNEVQSVLEAGCGEGEVSAHVYECFAGKIHMEAFDISEKVIEEAKAKRPEIDFFTGSIYEENRGDGHELVLCCEVLEHLENPKAAIGKLLEQTNKYLIISVPREPIWRVLNMARGKYWKDLGNTPGHIQHWSSKGIAREFEGFPCRVIAMIKPLPWTMLLIEKEKG